MVPPATAAAGKDLGGGMPGAKCTRGMHRGRESFVAAGDAVNDFLRTAVWAEALTCGDGGIPLVGGRAGLEVFV
jgi:hypothetical protein